MLDLNISPFVLYFLIALLVINYIDYRYNRGWLLSLITTLLSDGAYLYIIISLGTNSFDIVRIIAIIQLVILSLKYIRLKEEKPL